MRPPRHHKTGSSPNTRSTVLLTLYLPLLCLILASVSLARASDLFPEIMPAPEYEPDEVVGIQMRALGMNNEPFDNAGIELTFRFASPDNKSVTGPIERFQTLFDNVAYRPMIDHAELNIGEAEIRGEMARVPVLISNENGDKAGYLFFLSRQSTGPHENCWMTDRVIRVTLPGEDSTIL